MTVYADVLIAVNTFINFFILLFCAKLNKLQYKTSRLILGAISGGVAALSIFLTINAFYEIVLIRPKTIDDINYVVDQVIEEKNPVILDLSFLEKESAPNFKLAGDKIKQMRTRYGAQALLLARSEEKNLIIISPKKVKVINKG